MKRQYLLYGAYLAFCVLFFGGVAATPFLAMSDSEIAEALHGLYGATCHQKLTRSHCVFDYNGSLGVEDCTEQNGTYVPEFEREPTATRNGFIGYKFPVCSRDVGLYGMMMVGAIAYPFFRRIETKEMYSPWLLVAAIVPLAIDGTLQLFGVYESTNTIRLLTGGIAGFAVSFYVIPILNRMFG